MGSSYRYRSITAVGKELGIHDSVLRRLVDKLRNEPAPATRRSVTQAASMPADQASKIARLREENERLRMERDILKLSSAVTRLCGAETTCAIVYGWEGRAVRLLEAQSPLKILVHGCMRT